MNWNFRPTVRLSDLTCITQSIPTFAFNSKPRLEMEPRIHKPKVPAIW